MSGINGTAPGPAKPLTNLQPSTCFVPPGLITKSLTVGTFTGRRHLQPLQAQSCVADHYIRRFPSLGALGVLVGAATGVIRARPVGISAILAGVHWFTIGSGYYG